MVAGVDEAGRGPLAGPVVAAAVVLPLGVELKGIKDSKLLNREQREELAGRVRKVAISIGVGQADHEVVDEINIHNAGCLAMRRAVESLDVGPDYLLVDGFPIRGMELPHEALIKGDRRSASIMAAAIIAKTTRDAHMRQMGERFPGYGFESHFGYSTMEHARALRERGPCAIHRRSFAPVATAERIISGTLQPGEVLVDLQAFWPMQYY